MASKRKHTSCTLKDKLEVLKRLDNGESASKLAVEFGVGNSTITDWKKNRSKIEQFCISTTSKCTESRQTAKTTPLDKLDSALFVWFSQEREKGTPISGPLIKEKALKLNKLMNGDESFVASTGWLDRFKKRHGIRQLAITGEQLSSDNAAAAEYLSTFADMIAAGNYSPQQIYNADETGLNFKALPSKSLAAKEEKNAPGFKISKERLTVLACSNAAGNHKLPLMVIGKSAKPRAFKNLNVNSLPVSYRNSKKAWMTSQLFKEWFDVQFVPEVTRFCQTAGLPTRALLFIDNATSHPSEGELVCGNIKAVFLPPNVTPLLQPMDQNVLQYLKLSYRKKLLRRILEDEDETLSLIEKLKMINIKDVIYWVAESWESVSEQLLKKSWNKLWPSLTFIDNPNQEADRTNVVQVVRELLQNIPGCEDANENDVDEWLRADDHDHEILDDQQIVEIVLKEPVNVSDESEGEADGDSEQRVSHSDAAAAFDVALRYVEQHSAATPADTIFLRRWRNLATREKYSSLRQKNLTDFFKPM